MQRLTTNPHFTYIYGNYEIKTETNIKEKKKVMVSNLYEKFATTKNIKARICQAFKPNPNQDGNLLLFYVYYEIQLPSSINLLSESIKMKKK